MRELDDLLLHYLEWHYGDAAESDKQAFHALLELSDPELMSYLLQTQPPAAELERVVALILDRTDS